MDEETLKRELRETYQRAPRTRTDSAGAGLGGIVLE